MLTTGRPIVILSKTGKGRSARRVELRIDTRKNQPDVLKEEQVEWEKDHGTRVELELTGTYRGGRTGVDSYLEQTVVANPHLELTYRSPKGEMQEYPRAAHELPREAQEIKPHPHGVELGMLLKMMQDSDGMSAKAALVDNFSRVSPALAQSVCEAAHVKPNKRAPDLLGEEIERLHKALGEVKVMAPPATCVVPIGEDLIVAGLKRRFTGAQYFSSTRPPAVYRGNPFVVECGIAYGGDLPLEEPAEVLRFANRVPLQYQPKACAISEAVYELNWRNYGLSQPRGSLPLAPMAIFVHLASVWVPFTSEAKEAVAHYPEMLKEITLALQDCGRRLASSLRARARLDSEAKRRSLFERYIPELGASIGKITSKPREDIEKIFYKALPNFVDMTEPVLPPEGTPPEGGEGGSAAAADAPPGDGDDDVQPKKRDAKKVPEPEGDGPKKRGAKKAAAVGVQPKKRAKTAEASEDEAAEEPPPRGAKGARAKVARPAKGGGAKGRSPQSGAKDSGKKPRAGKKGEQLKLID
jgi:DNA topoisomerase-6 subunit B